MKFLKKASLAVSIAAVSFAANAELVAMDETALSAATGQAGIDLDIKLNGTEAISIGSVVYTDEGSLTISGISIGAADNGELVLGNTIDIDSDGNLVIGTDEITKALLVQVDSIDLNGGANLVKDLSLNILMGAGETVIGLANADNVAIDGIAAGTTVINHTGSFEITDGSVDLLAGGIQVDGIKVHGIAGAGNKVETEVTMWATANELNVKTGFTGTIELGSVALGSDPAAQSIGSVAINNLSMTGATLQIRGHQ